MKKNLPIILILGLKSEILSGITIALAATYKNFSSLFLNAVSFKNNSTNRTTAVKMSML